MFRRFAALCAVGRSLRSIGCSTHFQAATHSCKAISSAMSTEAVVQNAAEYAHSRESFLEFFPILRKMVLDDEIYNQQSGFARDWMMQMMTYNVPGGKLNRGMAVYDVLKVLKGDKEISKDEIFKANSLGWCIEWLQAFFLVADDIMDNSITRRGQPCWYRQENVGMIAFNDAIVLEASIYRILKKTFGQETYYGHVLELFHETTSQTAYGQMLDLITSPPDKVDLSRYTVENYFNIVTFKTAYYSFYLPVACGLVIGGIRDEKALAVAKSILIPMGQYFQVQDDYLDCFADPEVLGKIGTDIQDNKCSWLICQALKIGSQAQKDKIMENYAKDEKAAIEAVKEVYRELELENLFKTYEAESYEQLTKAIDSQTVLPDGVFTGLLKKIYKRTK